MKPVAGMTLGNRYRLQRLIAVGGMGEVWAAHDTSLARDVAVKVLREEYVGQEEFLDRLRTEARNSAGLSHTNIAQLYDYGEQSGSGFLVMELVVGEPMSDLLEREPVLSPKRLLPILAQTARGLHAAHVGGVVHRDIKPGNILLEHGAVVKITDFGVSLAANQIPMTATGMVMGTAQYLSPEQAIGKPATGASDIYALGIVAYESLVGHRPFTGPTAVDIAVAHVNEEVPPLPQTIHVDLAALVMKMLAKDPTERPRSGASLASMLDQIGASIADDPYGRRPVGRRALGAAAPAAASRFARSIGSAASAGSPGSPVSVGSTGSPFSPVSAGSALSPGSPTSEPLGLRSSVRSSTGRHGATADVDRRVPPSPAPIRVVPDPFGVPKRARQAGHRASSSTAGGAVPTTPAVPPPPTNSGSGEGSQLLTRAALRARETVRAREAKQDATPPRYATRRAPQPTGLRFGKLSWPLIGLLILIALLLCALVINGLTGSGSRNETADSAATRVGSVVASPSTFKDE